MAVILNTRILWPILAGFIWLSGAQAADDWAAESDPHRLVELTTERVLAVIEGAQEYSTTDPDRFSSEVERVLDQVVDFDVFARSVMGKYASAQRYRALKTDAERAEFRARVERFSNRFRRGLVDTYAQGLLAFSGQRIEVVAPRGGEVSDQSARVLQRIYGDTSGKPYAVQYTLRKDAEGHWKLRNVIIEGINIGATYRNQFAAAVESHGGDIDAAIANWSVEPELDSEEAVTEEANPAS